MTNALEIKISDVEGLSKNTIARVNALGHHTLGDISLIEFPQLYNEIGFGQGKILLEALVKSGITARFSKYAWNERIFFS